jgi:hypothetical protein
MVRSLFLNDTTAFQRGATALAAHLLQRETESSERKAGRAARADSGDRRSAAPRSEATQRVLRWESAAGRERPPL